MSFRSLESVIQKSHVKLLVGLGPYIHAFIHTWASLGASGGSSEVCQPGLHRNPNIHTYICMYICMFFVSRDYGECVEHNVSEVRRVCELYGF